MKPQALILDIKRDSSEDGPGIRTTVFFKGCPLSCTWCHNPEGKNKYPECDIHGNEVGRWIDLDELLYRVLIDKPFYASTGGGVTLSGGEPTLQMDFAHEFLKRLKQEKVHTAIETCGMFNYNRFEKLLLPWLDLVYYDLKLYSELASIHYTGRTNKPILKNLLRLVDTDSTKVIPRIPLIPGITTTKENLEAWSRFLRDHGIKQCALMPYNPLWHDKARRLGRKPEYTRDTFMTEDELETCNRYFYSVP